MGNRSESVTGGASRVLNAFTPTEVAAIAGLSLHMLNYLARTGYLPPHYGGGTRGVRRHYSYRDLMVARILARLLSAGLEISRLRKALATLRDEAGWLRPANLGMLVTDGRNLYQASADGSLADLTAAGQLTFAFVLDLGAVRKEVVVAMDDVRRANFDAENKRLRREAG